MASPLLAGLGVAAAAYTAKQLVQLYARMKTAPPSMRAFYKGGFEPVMTRTEASRILGLRADSSEEKVKEAHRRIMIANHPDSGGSSYIAAKVNMAKDLLLGKHKDAGLK